jgi:hypothetical protein
MRPFGINRMAITHPTRSKYITDFAKFVVKGCTDSAIFNVKYRARASLTFKTQLLSRVVRQKQRWRRRHQILMKKSGVIDERYPYTCICCMEQFAGEQGFNLGTTASVVCAEVDEAPQAAVGSAGKCTHDGELICFACMIRSIKSCSYNFQYEPCNCLVCRKRVDILRGFSCECLLCRKELEFTPNERRMIWGTSGPIDRAAWKQEYMAKRVGNPANDRIRRKFKKLDTETRLAGKFSLKHSKRPINIATESLD